MARFEVYSYHHGRAPTRAVGVEVEGLNFENATKTVVARAWGWSAARLFSDTRWGVKRMWPTIKGAKVVMFQHSRPSNRIFVVVHGPLVPKGPW